MISLRKHRLSRPGKSLDHGLLRTGYLQTYLDSGKLHLRKIHPTCTLVAPFRVTEPENFAGYFSCLLVITLQTENESKPCLLPCFSG